MAYYLLDRLTVTLWYCANIVGLLQFLSLLVAFARVWFLNLKDRRRVALHGRGLSQATGRDLNTPKEAFGIEFEE